MNTQPILANRYEVQKQLGQRPGCQTLLAFDRNTQNLVVIKLLTFGDGFEWQSLKLFEREAKVLKSLTHPAIPQYLEYFETEKGFALVQSYIDARSLEHHIKSGKTFSETEISQIAQSILKVLIYLHAQFPPIIHRDIKPSNLLISTQKDTGLYRVYLIDFGSVQNSIRPTQDTITIVGTYGYMPLEQFGGQPVPASDLYSLGATIIYLMTGQHPAELPKDAGRIAFEKVINPSYQLARWLRSITELSLEQRLNSAEVALNHLEQLYSQTQNVQLNQSKIDVHRLINNLEKLHDY